MHNLSLWILLHDSFLHTLFWIILALGIIGFLVWHFLLRKPKAGGVFKLPLAELGFRDLPAVPFSAEATIKSALSLSGRTKEMLQALNGLSREYSIDGQTHNARSFLFGDAEQEEHEEARNAVIKEIKTVSHLPFLNTNRLKDRLSKESPLDKRADSGDLTRLAIDAPEKFALSLTEYNQIYEKAKEQLPTFADALKVDGQGPETATKNFWPGIAKHGLAFNLLIPKKMPASSAAQLEGKKLYQIDMRYFEQFAPTETNQRLRFCPGIIVDLYQDPTDLNLIPYRIQLFKERGEVSETYESPLERDVQTTPSMWVYALLAAKSTITVWGIWLGHVYHWHIVTAALQMTMFQKLAEAHPVRKLLDPMSEYLIGFDDFLLLTFSHVAPPTPFKTGLDFLGLVNYYAKGRNYHDDDPIPTLEHLGINEADFSTDPATPWNKYPIVKYLLDIWNASESYVTAYVQSAWPNDEAVIADEALHSWLDASRSPKHGNVMGIPGMNGTGAQKELIRFLTSYVYRITAHGGARMNTTANPTLSFVANYPPCLQNGTFEAPNYAMNQEELLAYLPNTGTIGNMITFLFTFVFSAPSVSFIPVKGIKDNLFFDKKELNDALIEFRAKIEELIFEYDPADPMIHQWPQNIET